MTLKSLRKTVFLSAIIVLCPFVSALAQTVDVGPVPPGASAVVVELPEGAIATVNGEPISEAAWIDTLKRAAGMSVLDVMIRYKLVEQAAAKRGVTVSDQEIQVEIDKAIAQTGGMDNLIARLREMGESLPDFQRRVRTETLLRKLVADSIAITDDELQKFFTEQYGRRAEAQVIAVGTKPEAEQVIAEASRDADFSQLAVRYSSDQTTKQNHGYLPTVLTEGFFPKPFGNVVITKPISDAVFALKVGEVSEPIPAGQAGFYVFKMVRLVPARDVKFDSVKEEVRAMAREMKTARKAAEYLQMLVQNAVVKVGLKQ